MEKYQLMDAQERRIHHEKLRDEGFEWCPECGSVLIWDLPNRNRSTAQSASAPVVVGDCPPLTRDQLQRQS